MFKDLLFIDEAMKAIFKIESAEQHNFSGTPEQPQITNEDYKELKKYLSLSEKFDLKILVGGLNILAYGHIDDKTEIIKYIKTHSVEIIQNIDLIVPNIDINLNSSAGNYYNNLLNEIFSYNIFNSLDIPHFPILNIERSYYGLKYLLLFLVYYCYEDFENWYFKTDRNDLKIYVASLIINPYCLHFDIDGSFANSKINWLKAYYLLSQYKISKFISYGNGKIEDVINLNISDDDKFDIFIYYLFKTYNGFDNNFKNKKQLKKDLRLLEKFNWQPLLTVAYLKRLNLWLDKYHILNVIIKFIENKNQRIEIYDYILYRINSYLEKDLPTTHDILLANVYGNEILDYGEDKIKEVESEYEQVKNQLLKPFCYHRNKKQWNTNICKLIFYTISLFIAYDKNNNKRKELISTFLSTKGDLPHYLDRDIDSIIKQLKKYIQNV